MSKRWRLILTSGVAIIAASVSGCGNGAESAHAHPAAATQAGTTRIVTLSPALSQMVMALGAGSKLVGVCEHDAAAPAGLPVVGTFFDVNAERLLSLHPGVVLLMTGNAGAPARLKQLADEGDFRLVTYPYPNRLRDIGWILAHRGTPSWSHVPDAPSVGQVLDQQKRARKLADRMFARLDALRKLTAGLSHPTVLLVIGMRPIMASGPDTVNDQLLHIAGGRNAAAGSSLRAPTYDREALIALQPQIIILLSPLVPALTAHDPRFASLRGLDIPAMQHHRTALINAPLVLLPSMSVLRTACAMARIIHPDQKAAIDHILNGTSRNATTGGQGGDGE